MMTTDNAHACVGSDAEAWDLGSIVAAVAIALSTARRLAINGEQRRRLGVILRETLGCARLNEKL
jgi:hypothetical protein